MESLTIVVLAAGLGKRMKSALPKVLHPLGGKPLLAHVLEVSRRLKPDRLVVVVGHEAEAVKQTIRDNGVVWVHQPSQLGTGHAVACAKPALADIAGDVLVLSGDVPRISSETLAELLRLHRERKQSLTFVTTRLENPTGYGRVLRDGEGEVMGIVEERDATENQKKISEINAGIYVVEPAFLFSTLENLRNDNDQQEYYLTDIVKIARGKGRRMGAYRIEDPTEILGINTRQELAAMEKALREKINRKWMDAGVTFKDPDTVYIDDGVVIGKETVIGPNTHLMGKTSVGEGCVIEGSAYIVDTKIADRVHLKFTVYVTGAVLEEGVILGPFAQLRPGTVLHRNVHVGNFVEVKNSIIGEGTKANHLSYIGDATLGTDTNIGAGTITCNYNGFEKFRTKIGDRVQIGSDTQLVAPVDIGDDAYIGAGATITQNVPPGALALSRTEQKHISGWVERFRRKNSKNK